MSARRCAGQSRLEVSWRSCLGRRALLCRSFMQWQRWDCDATIHDQLSWPDYHCHKWQPWEQ